MPDPNQGARITWIHPTGYLTLTALLLCSCLTAHIALADDGRRPPTTGPAVGPTPKMSPLDVVKTVVGALGQNDATDAGIRTTFAFASPANQQVTGPIERFIPLVKNAAYAPLLTYAKAEYREVGVKGDQAAELVTLTDAAGVRVMYLFQLSKQADAGPLKDCWMTDGVVRVEPKPGQLA